MQYNVYIIQANRRKSVCAHLNSRNKGMLYDNKPRLFAENICKFRAIKNRRPKNKKALNIQGFFEE